MAGAEGDRERGQDQRHPERSVLADRLRTDVGGHDDLWILHQDREAVRHRLQLQRDIGKNPDDRDDGDQAAEQRALAVARGDEIGQRRDAILLGDAQDLALNDPPQGDHECRADIDRQKTNPVTGRAADATVERPRRRINRERQAVHVRAGDDRPAGVRASVGVVGDGEQDAQIRERDENDDRLVQHGRLPFPSPATRRRMPSTR